MNGGGVPDDASSSDLRLPLARGTGVEVLLVFLCLGCASFGGPIAHLGYFQKEFVERRKWCSQRTLTEIIALAQSLPGPASSQVGAAAVSIVAGAVGRS
jgi:chromate transporter